MKHCINKYCPITYDEKSKVCEKCKYNVKAKYNANSFMKDFLREINKGNKEK